MDAACSRVKMFIHEALEGEKKKKIALVSSRVGTIGIFHYSRCPNAKFHTWNVSESRFFFFFTSIAKILQFSILIICKIGKHFSSYKISIQLIGIVFTRGINLSAPCTRIVEARRRLFLLTRAHTKAVNVEGV